MSNSGNQLISDEQALRRFASGERAMLGLIAQRHERELLGLARAILAGRDDLAAEAVQEAWVRVIRHAASFRCESSVKTWLYRITVNRCVELREKERRLGRRLTVAHEKSSSDDAISHDSGLPRHLLLEALESLPEAPRTVLLLCYHRDLTQAQVAEVLGIPIGTVKSRLNTALVATRARLGSEVKS